MAEQELNDNKQNQDQAGIRSEAKRDSIEAASAMTREIAAQMRHASDLSRKLNQAAHDMTENLDALAVLAPAVLSGFEDLQWEGARLFETMVRSNIRATLDMMRLAYPRAQIELQQRLAREYLDMLNKGSAAILSAARRTAEETLRYTHDVAARQAEQRRHPNPDGLYPSRDGSVARRQRASRVADVMNRGIRVAKPDDTVQQAAQLMREDHTGVLPVGEDDRLVGLVTDHDVAIHLVAEARDPAQTKVREVMSRDVRYLFDDVDLQHAADILAEQPIRRLPVVTRERRLVGMVSLGDLAAEGHVPRARHSAPREPEPSSQVAAE